MVDLSDHQAGIQAAMNNIVSPCLDPIGEAIKTLTEHGAQIKGTLNIGQLTRVKGDRCKGADKDFWYVYNQIDDSQSSGHIIGVMNFGYWKDGTSFPWCSRSTNKMNAVEQIAFKKAQDQMRAEQAQAEAIKHGAAAKRAYEIWSNAPDAVEHKYLTNKGVTTTQGLKIVDDGRLIIPIAVDNEIVSLQLINNEGDKRFLTGGKLKGGWFLIEGEIDLIYIAEGYSTACSVHMATGATVYVAFNAGNLYEVCKHVKATHPTSQLVIAADDDTGNKLNIGRVKAEQAVKKLNIQVVFPKEFNDFNDQHKSQGLEHLRSYLQDQKQFNRMERGNFGFISVSELTKNIKPPVWLIDDYIEVHTLSCMFGASGSGKSFLAIDISCCVATGIDYHGHVVKKGAVFYIAGEGHHGLSKRFKAWEIHNKISLENASIHVSKVAANLNSEEFVSEVIKAIHSTFERTKEKPILIIVDTLARNFGDGDENSTKDMTSFITNLDLLKNNWGASVLTVHHTGLQDANRARGSSALKAAMDHEYCVYKNKNIIQMQCKKSKDSEEPPNLQFKLLTVPIVYSGECAPLLGAALTFFNVKNKPYKLSKNEVLGISTLKKCIEKYGEKIDISKDGVLVEAVSLEQYRENLKTEKISSSDKADSINKAMLRIIEKLKKYGFITVTEDFVALLDIPDNVGQI